MSVWLIEPLIKFKVGQQVIHSRPSRLAFVLSVEGMKIEQERNNFFCEIDMLHFTYSTRAVIFNCVRGFGGALYIPQEC